MMDGKTPCHKISENKRFFSFLDPKRLRPGHTVVLPKDPTDWIFDLDERTLADLFLFSRPIAQAIKQVVSCQKVAVIVYGLKVRHAHLHLVPVDGTPGELDLSKCKKASDEELSRLARKIKKALDRGDHRLRKAALFSPSA